MNAKNRIDRVASALGDVAAPANPENLDTVLESIVGERGGASAFSPSQVAAARRLARMLVEETGRLDAPGVGVLLEMLPPKPATEQVDVAKMLATLDRDELSQLARLIAKATGVSWKEPASGAGPNQHPFHRPDGPGAARGCMCAYCMPRDADGNLIPRRS
jgi:hypothetical protein